MSDLFDRARLIGTPAVELALETRGRNAVRNSVGLEAVAYGQERKFWAMVRNFQWEARRPPTGVYNCAGHVWAARRTGIFESSAWALILADDAYRVLDEKERVLPGDLVLYRLIATDDILHVGEIVEVRQVSGLGGCVPWVLSKLDASSGEVLHAIGQVPYEKQGLPYRTEIRTDRPRQEGAKQ